MARTVLLTASLLAAFCGLASAADGPASPLFTRLGGSLAIQAIASDTIDAAAKSGATVAGDPAGAKQKFAQFLCARTGGGCTGSAGDEFIALVEPLRIALRAHNVPLAARNELLEVLAPARRDFAQR
jgi:hypothetical protein